MFFVCDFFFLFAYDDNKILQLNSHFELPNGLSLTVPKACLLHFILKEPVQSVGALVVFCVRAVVCSAVAEDPLHVRDEQALVDVVVVFQPLRYRLQVWPTEKEVNAFQHFREVTQYACYSSQGTLTLSARFFSHIPNANFGLGNTVAGFVKDIYLSKKHSSIGKKKKSACLGIKKIFLVLYLSKPGTMQWHLEVTLLGGLTRPFFY